MTRNPQQKLTRERIFEAALELIEDTGVASLNMRALARVLQVAPMTLYNYVSDKEDILDGIANHALSAWSLEVDPTLSWQRRLSTIFGRIEAALEKQPGVLELLLLRSVQGPAINALRERVVVVLTEAGFAPRPAIEGLGMLYAYTLGFAAVEHRQRNSPDRLRGVSAAEFPHLSLVTEHYRSRTAPDTFHAGLEHLMTGLATQHPRSDD
jgi:TetR/AcrR family tetracycline transcriptional repressor